jgi:hypothetical protein
VKAQQRISDILPKYLFWDMNIDTLDLKKDKDIIIPRALFVTTPDTFSSDIKELEKIYSRTEIVEELKYTKERISNKVCSMVSERYHIPAFARFK